MANGVTCEVGLFSYYNKKYLIKNTLYKIPYNELQITFMN